MDLKKFQVLCLIVSNRLVIVKAFKIALFIGTVLNLINQGDILLAGTWENVHWFKLGLTYCVPFGVSLYTALSMGIKFVPNTQAMVDTLLICATCGETHHHAKMYHTLPQCPLCLEKTEWIVI